ESLVIAPWPKPFEGYADAVADARIADVQKLVTEVRRFRADQGLKPGQKVAARVAGAGFAEVSGHEASIRSLVRLTPAEEGFSASASLEVALATGIVTVELDLSGTVDVAAERKRLQKDLGVAEKELLQTEGKLANESFIAKAPAPVIEKIKLRRETAAADIDRITARLASLPAS
ncbi:MAG TPA: valine--tRNA ligase, partial [Amycolatopsis sp.]